jgi:16S rRNA (guanine527-N7)-methyltransferase
VTNSATPGGLEQLLRQQLSAGLQQMDLTVAESDQQKLVQYVTTLTKWNKTHNLTAVRDPEQMIGRHLLDSLSIAKYLEGRTLLDVGSGAGLPGIPLAVTQPHLNVTLVDSVLKKTRFMLFAARELDLGNVDVRHTRIESVSRTALNTDTANGEAGFDMIVARAFSTTQKLCELSGHLLSARGRILAMIGRPVDTDHSAVGDTVQIDSGDTFSVTRSEKLFVPGETAHRNIVILQRSAV